MKLTSPTPPPQVCVSTTESILCVQVSQNPVCAAESILCAQVRHLPFGGDIGFIKVNDVNVHTISINFIHIYIYIIQRKPIYKPDTCWYDV